MISLEQLTNFTIGTDFEFFVFEKNTKEIIPPMALHEDFGIPIKREKDKIILYETSEVKITSDGAAHEFLTRPYLYKDYIRMYTECRNAHRLYMNYLKRFRVPIKNNEMFGGNILGKFNPERYWENRGMDFLDCVRIGCNPDSSAYESIFGKDSSGERMILDDEFRFAGGHLHISAPENDPELFIRNDWVKVAVLMDFFVGTTNVIFPRISADLEEEQTRLLQYGSPGRIRLQDYGNNLYGIEYRPPSSFWTRRHEYGRSLFKYMKVVRDISIENGVSRLFSKLEPHILELYNSLVDFDVNSCKNLRAIAIHSALKEGIIRYDQI